MSASREWGWAMGVVAAAVLIGVMPSSPRNAIFWDTQVKLQVAENFFAGNGPTLTGGTPLDRYYIVQGRDGRRVSFYPFLVCLVQMPIRWVHQLTGWVWGGLPTMLALAGLATILVAWGRRSGVKVEAASAGALMACLGTTLWPSAVHGYDNVFEAAALAAILWAAAGGSLRDWFFVGLFTGLAYNFRYSGALLAVPIAVLLLAQQPRTVKLVSTRAFWVGVGGLPGLLVSIWYNWYRFGVGVWGPPTTYAEGDTSMMEGLLGLLLSPGKGVFWYAPILVAAAIISPWLRRRWPGPVYALGAWIAVSTLFYSRHDFWHGDWCWGPRYLAPIALIAAPLTWKVWEWSESQPLRMRGLLAGMAALLILFQGFGVIPQPMINYSERFLTPMLREGRFRSLPKHPHPLRPDWDILYFKARNSPLVFQYASVFDIIVGNPARHGRGELALLLLAPLSGAAALWAMRGRRPRRPPSDTPVVQ